MSKRQGGNTVLHHNANATLPRSLRPRRYIGLPTAPARYQVLHSCLEELVRVGIVAPPSYLPASFSKAVQIKSATPPPPSSFQPSSSSSSSAAAGGPIVSSPPLEAVGGRNIGLGVEADMVGPCGHGGDGGDGAVTSKGWKKSEAARTGGKGAGLFHPGSNGPTVNGNDSSSSSHGPAMADGGDDVLMSSASVGEGALSRARYLRIRFVRRLSAKSGSRFMNHHRWCCT